MRQTAIQAAFCARLALPPTPKQLPEPTRQHDGTADKMREGVRVLTELERTETLLALSDVLGPATQPNRADRRAKARAARRGQQ